MNLRINLSITLIFIILLTAAVLLINVYAQVPPRGQIAFTSNRDGNPEVYFMDTEGKNLRNLTNHPARDGAPAWSPDGRWIAFASDREGGPGNLEIYLMIADLSILVD